MDPHGYLSVLVVRLKMSAQTCCTWTSGIGPCALQAGGVGASGLGGVGWDNQGWAGFQTSQVLSLTLPPGTMTMRCP